MNRARSLLRTLIALLCLGPGAALADLRGAPCRPPAPNYRAYLDFLQRRGADPREDRVSERALRDAYPEEAFRALGAGDGRCVLAAAELDRPLAFVLRPRTLPGQRWPLILYLRDGLDPDARLPFGDVLDLMTLAARGFVVVAPEYRAAASGDELGGAEARALDAVLREAQLAPDVDPGQLFLLGAGRGAINLFQAMARWPSVRAAAALGAMADLEETLRQQPALEQRLRQAIPDFAARRQEHLRARSPLRWVERLRSPTLLLHGDRDRLASPGKAAALVESMRRQGVDAMLLRYPSGHEILSHRAEARAQIERFFRRAALPPLPLNHLYVVLPEPSFLALRAAPFLRRLAAVDRGLPEFAAIDERADVLYLRGRETYLEIMGPGNHFHEPVHKVGIGLGAEEPGSLPRVFAALEAAGRRPWLSGDYVTFAGPTPVPWKETTGPGAPLAPEIDLWVSAYRPSFTRWLNPGASDSGLLRRDFIGPRFDPGRLLLDVVAITLRVPPERLAPALALLEDLGLRADRDAPDRVRAAAGLRVELVARPGPARLLGARLALTRAATCDERFGGVHLRCAGTEATITLEEGP